MKPKPSGHFDPEAFLRSGDKARTESPPKPRRSKAPATGKAPQKGLAPGRTRCSIDLPDELYLRLKIAAARARRPMRALLEEALEAHLPPE